MSKSLGTPTENTVDRLYSNRVFMVPDYQRTYAWEEQQTAAFWEDIIESIDTDTPHYWGQITLQDMDDKEKTGNSGLTFPVFEVVDGQQRLTTISVFMLALESSALRIKDKEIAEKIRANFLVNDGVYRIELGSLNKDYLHSLFDGNFDEAPDMRTNKRLKDAYEYFKDMLNSYLGNEENPRESISKVFDYVRQSTLALEYVLDEGGISPKIFQAINDRGKDLTVLDKCKSFLFFYSYKLLENNADFAINGSFGDVLRDFDEIQDIGDDEGIDYISGYQFTDDRLLELYYHYFAKHANNKYNIDHSYHYKVTSERVYNNFVKASCSELKSDRDSLKSFIVEFSNDFSEFVKIFRSLVELTKKESDYKHLFSFLGLDSLLYPLLISIHKENLIDSEMLRAIEVLDFRVYKVRGTDPRANIYKETISKIKGCSNRSEVIRKILNNSEDFMPDGTVREYLSWNIYGNRVVKYILWEYITTIEGKFDRDNYKLFDNMVVEHIFPRDPEFDVRGAYGFEDTEDYDYEKNRLGNLTLLEEDIDKRCGNKSLKEKAKLYRKSDNPEIHSIAADIDNDKYDKDYIEERTKKIADFCINRWSINK